jgi:hypothetical protein
LPKTNQVYYRFEELGEKYSGWLFDAPAVLDG